MFILQPRLMLTGIYPHPCLSDMGAGAARLATQTSACPLITSPFLLARSGFDFYGKLMPT